MMVKLMFCFVNHQGTCYILDTYLCRNCSTKCTNAHIVCYRSDSMLIEGNQLINFSIWNYITKIESEKIWSVLKCTYIIDQLIRILSVKFKIPEIKRQIRNFCGDNIAIKFCSKPEMKFAIAMSNIAADESSSNKQLNNCWFVSLSRPGSMIHIRPVILPTTNWSKKIRVKHIIKIHFDVTHEVINLTIT